MYFFLMTEGFLENQYLFSSYIYFILFLKGVLVESKNWYEWKIKNKKYKKYLKLDIWKLFFCI